MEPLRLDPDGVAPFHVSNRMKRFVQRCALRLPVEELPGVRAILKRAVDDHDGTAARCPIRVYAVVQRARLNGLEGRDSARDD